MKGIKDRTEQIIFQLQEYLKDRRIKRTYIDEEPLRSELYTSVQMERYSKTLAESHKVISKGGKDQLLKRLSDNEKILLEVRTLITQSLGTDNLVTPAGEWLMDNFYLIEDQIKTAKKHLPRGYSENLPQLANKPGTTRVYDIVLQIISHSDGWIDLNSLSNFINNYQTVTPLQIGELWAIPIMLRIALIENLRRVSTHIAVDRIDRNLANYWATRMIETAEKRPRDLIITIAEMTRTRPPLVSAFVAELTRLLSGKGPSLGLALNWIEQRLIEIGTSGNDLIFAENQKQAADQVSMRNSIGSLRMLTTMDWRDFVEEHSIVEQRLRQDPAQIYARMDFNTRDHYRHVLEHLVKKSKLSEKEVSDIVLQLAGKGHNDQLKKDSTNHVGYYLVGKGLLDTYKALNLKRTFFDVLKTFTKKRAFFLYISSISILTLAVTSVVFMKMLSKHINPALEIVIVIFCLVSSSQLAIAVINFFCTLLVKPSLLNRMDFSKGIPDEYRTLIVIPVLITSLNEIDDMVEALEVRFLANKDNNLRFGLLTDLIDANKEILPNDEILIKHASQSIKELNSKYKRDNIDFFYLFHRPRHWNPADKVWMGHERKRGKLCDLNALLRGKGEGKFSMITGDQSILQTIKYVITLDADTQLPHGVAWKLASTMAHPLNKPSYNEKKQRVTEGYGILQPRISVSLPDLSVSHYAKLHGNEPGIDPYTRATSDVYQDLFEEGSFIGKGIYDVDIFEKAMTNTFPQNLILSHDLLEGCYIRSGLVSDIQLYEKYPATYRADTKRRTRWIRGDWQILPWATPFVPGVDRHWHKNPLSLLSRWKIFDNLRRSIVPIALTTFIVLGWTLLGNPVFWTAAVSTIIIFPIIVTTIWDMIKKPKDLVFTQHIILFSLSTGGIIVKTLFALICLPYEAFCSFISILRTNWRTIFSHKRLLEWNTAAHEERKRVKNLINEYGFMWPEPCLAILVFCYLSFHSSASLPVAMPILLLWIITPAVTWWTSKPLAKKVSALTKEQLRYLRILARKTWGFFERFIGEEDNWLPPDNYQEHPVAVVAHRTSPTNIGIYLLSNLAAYDFGYITPSQLLKRTKQTFETIQKLEKFKGHLYNWYDTRTLQPLKPKYISSVDNGNFIGHLLTLKQGLLELPDRKIISTQIFEALKDTLSVLTKSLENKNPWALNDLKHKLEKACQNPPSNPQYFCSYIEELSSLYSGAAELLTVKANSPAEWWKQQLKEQITEAVNYTKLLLPWQMLSSAPEGLLNILNVPSPTLKDVVKIANDLSSSINKSVSNSVKNKEWLSNMLTALTDSSRIAQESISIIQTLCYQCDEFTNCDWDFLYDKEKSLLTIGYKPEEHQADHSYYDLLASEARLGVFVGIAQNKIPEESWFALGRLITNPGSAPVLLSWSGSMFEYLMPMLIMPSYENTLLDQTYKMSVKRQIEYGNQQGVPWGNSESEYNTVDVNSNYQYSAFGTPGLGLKRGLNEDLVVAPYASMLALMVEPEKSCQNLELMSKEGFEGEFGFYESIDYTPSRLTRNQKYVLIHAYMTHHQGMGFLGLAYLLLNQPMQKRFEAEPQFRANLLLLQERIPKTTSYYAHTTSIVNKSPSTTVTEVRINKTPNTPIPEVQLLSNGKYHLMVTNAGGGYSKWKDIDISRFREDSVRDNWGSFCYIYDVTTERYWSSCFQPTLKKVKNYEAAFSQSRVDFRGLQNDIEMHTEIVVSPEDDIEMRRLNLTNRSNIERIIEVTSYTEVVLAHPAADALHPAFNNLFVQTEILEEQRAVLCTRRPRSVNEHPPWMFCLMNTNNAEVEEVSYETNRLKFIGRGNTTENPEVMGKPGKLSGSQGSVLDPIVAIRYRIILKPEQSAAIDMIMGVGETRETCMALIEKYQDSHHKDRVFELAWTHSQVVLRHINATESDAQLYTRLASSIIFTNPSLRADPSILIKNHRGQSGLWGYAISGDLPIVLVQIKDQSNIKLIKQLIQAHTYWHLKGLKVDLVIWNEDYGGYRQMLQNQIQELIAAEMTDKAGGIFVRATDQISYEDRVLFQTVSRIVLSDADGTLEDHLNRKPIPKAFIPLINFVPADRLLSSSDITPPRDLQFFNGFGGFNKEGNEYVILVNGKNYTPAPWANVIANPHIGTVISESGQAYTWAENAHEYRLTPWNNDPVCDSAGEAYYIRDEETGRFWTPTLLPKGGPTSYIIRHGMGYSVFEHTEEEIHSEVSVYVDLEDPIKYIVIKIKNASDRPRRLSATGYMEWILGDQRSKTAMHIYSEFNRNNGAIFVRNPYNTEFQGRVAFFDTNERRKTYTCDRAEFIGRNGSLKNPEAMNRVRLSGRSGGGLDPCTAIQVTFDLNEGEEREICFKLGSGKDMGEAVYLVQKLKGADEAVRSLQKVKEYWKNTLTAIKVETPDTATNLIANGWLLYQTIVSRLWGRSGYYQSGGAFGFRDQLQDVLSLLHAQPDLAKQQILLAATRQFKEGDVQHWWHPPSGRGVRTRCSDDYLWLPYLTCRYIEHTGDNSILNESLIFLEGRLLSPGEDSYYDVPSQSQQRGSLYEHCVKSLRNGFRYGEHGLPLMGTGDWNDGMDQVGKEGKGESVWLGFFLYKILTMFTEIAEWHNDSSFAAECKKEAEKLKENIEKNAWDGKWYKRAYFDDGTPLGSSENEECKIDSLSQSWAVISGVANKERAIAALHSAYKYLVHEKDSFICLLDPAFNKSKLNPGYIKGYVPGVRENGGQYTHAAIWLADAFAQIGDTKSTWKLFKILNPVNHGKTAEEISTYKIEPYVIAADIYSEPPNAGHGGWTWYTGSAGWMYQFIIESLLGIKRRNDKLYFSPCVPAEWKNFTVTYRYKSTTYVISFSQKNTGGTLQVKLDGKENNEDGITLADDGAKHSIEVIFFSGTTVLNEELVN
jgi:cellobiose phosphorylase